MEQVLAVAGQQHALFTAAQWKAAGLSRRSLSLKEAAGIVRQIYPGVFALAGAPVSFEQRVLAACLSVDGVASHRCAAYLWGFRKFETPTVEVLTRKDHTPCREASQSGGPPTRRAQQDRLRLPGTRPRRGDRERAGARRKQAA